MSTSTTLLLWRIAASLHAKKDSIGGTKMDNAVAADPAYLRKASEGKGMKEGFEGEIRELHAFVSCRTKQ
jgi:hypothetical protein